MTSAESIMKTINSLPHEEKWTLIHNLEELIKQERQKMHDEAQPFTHYEAVIETKVEPVEYETEDGDIKIYKPDASDYKYAREIITDCSCWLELVKRVMEESHVNRGKAEDKDRGVTYPYCGPYNVPVKNVKVKLNKTSSGDHISITLSWDSWQIEHCYIDKEMDDAMVDCPHFLFMDNYKINTFSFSSDFTLKSLDYEEPSEDGDSE
jgi:hypothetical protein